jgi:(p)ppGpp synthase/HD superfamily hydrolase
LECGDTTVKKSMLSNKEWTTGVVSHLTADTVTLIQDVLDVLLHHVIEDRRVSRADINIMLSKHVLSQVCAFLHTKTLSNASIVGTIT